MDNILITLDVIVMIAAAVIFTFSHGDGFWRRFSLALMFISGISVLGGLFWQAIVLLEKITEKLG